MAVDSGKQCLERPGALAAPPPIYGAFTRTEREWNFDLRLFIINSELLPLCARESTIRLLAERVA